MTHDPRCPVSIHDEAHLDWSYHCAGNAECEEITCQCDLIAEVRAAIVDGLKKGLPESPTRDSAVAIATFATSGQ